MGERGIYIHLGRAYVCSAVWKIEPCRNVTVRELEARHRRRRGNGTSELFRRPDAYAEGFALRMEQRVL